MTVSQQDFLHFLEGTVFNKVAEATRSGQREYAHDEANAFRNFEALADDLNLAREEVLWVFLQKHLDGILAWINGHRSQRESVQGRIQDAIVYLAILWRMSLDEQDEVAP